MFPVFVLKQ